MDVISKKQMSEEDIKLHYITPITIRLGWKPSIQLGFFPSHA